MDIIITVPTFVIFIILVGMVAAPWYLLCRWIDRKVQAYIDRKYPSGDWRS